MTFPADALIVLIASPSDTAAERAAVFQSLSDWNVHRGEAEGVVLVPWLYEQHAIPLLGQGAQSLINRQALDRADIVIAFFDARLGSATTDAVSGTAEEIERAHDAGKPVHVYFSSEPVPREHIEADQIVRLQAFRAELESRGLLGNYRSPADLASQARSAVEFDLRTALAKRAAAAPQRDNSVKWELKSNGGDTYLVANTGDAVAKHVEVGANDDLHMAQVPEPEDVAPGEALEFMAIVLGAVKDRRVLVTWRDAQTDETLTWKHPLPQRPPRRR